MELIKKKVSELIPYINNSRTHSEEQITQIVSSIKEFGFTNPILIDKDNSIIAGHGRLQAVKRLGLEEVPCILISGLTKTQIKALIIADNQLALNAGWDLEKLSVEIEGLEEDKFDLSLLGFEDDFIKDLLAEENKGLTDEDAVPEVKENPKTKLGDVFILGNHRLMCGDATIQNDVEKLMNKSLADMVFTDPPYNVAVKGKFTGSIKNDNLTDDEFNNLLSKSANNLLKYNKGSFYICYEIKNHTQFETAYSILNKIDEIIIWNKDSASFYSKDKYNRKYEAILFIKGNGQLDCNKETNVWDYAKSSSFNSRDENNKRFNETGNFLVAHPTSKPVKLIERALNNSSKKQDIILDLFGGSGSTLIACEKLGRKANIMELDPKYCDVIIQRWQQFTGKEAIHEQSGKTYNSI